MMTTWKETEKILLSLGMDERNVTEWCSRLGKWDSFNFMPDCEVRSYLKLWRIFCDDKMARIWAGYSYDCCFYMWQRFELIWSFRKNLPLKERWSWKRRD